LEAGAKEDSREVLQLLEQLQQAEADVPLLSVPMSKGKKKTEDDKSSSATNREAEAEEISVSLVNE